MRFENPLIGRLTGLLASMLFVGAATAADATPQDSASPVMSAISQSAPQRSIGTPGIASAGITPEISVPAPSVSGMGPAVGVDALDDFRGGADTDNTVLIDGRVNNNTADRIVSGSNLIQDGAFANANGISTVIQNSGSNVLIQNGMVVTVQFSDPGL